MIRSNVLAVLLALLLAYSSATDNSTDADENVIVQVASMGLYPGLFCDSNDDTDDDTTGDDVDPDDGTGDGGDDGYGTDDDGYGTDDDGYGTDDDGYGTDDGGLPKLSVSPMIAHYHPNQDVDYSQICASPDSWSPDYSDVSDIICSEWPAYLGAYGTAEFPVGFPQGDLSNMNCESLPTADILGNGEQWTALDLMSFIGCCGNVVGVINDNVCGESITPGEGRRLFTDGTPTTTCVEGDITVTADSTGLSVTGSLTGLEATVTGGIHIHSGLTCDLAEDVEGHWWNSDIPDPWTTTTYTSDDAGMAEVSITVTTEDLGYDPLEFVGRTVVVHDSTGTRVACGMLIGEGATIDDDRSSGLSGGIIALIVILGCILVFAIIYRVACSGDDEEDGEAPEKVPMNSR